MSDNTAVRSISMGEDKLWDSRTLCSHQYAIDLAISSWVPAFRIVFS